MNFRTWAVLESLLTRVLSVHVCTRVGGMGAWGYLIIITLMGTYSPYKALNLLLSLKCGMTEKVSEQAALLRYLSPVLGEPRADPGHGPRKTGGGPTSLSS